MSNNFEIFMTLEFHEEVDTVYTIGFIALKYKNFTVDYLSPEKERENLIDFLKYLLAPEMSYNIFPVTIHLSKDSSVALLRLFEKYQESLDHVFNELCDIVKSKLKVENVGNRSEQTKSLINYDATKCSTIAVSTGKKLWQIRDFYTTVSRTNYLDCEKLMLLNQNIQ